MPWCKNCPISNLIDDAKQGKLDDDYLDADGKKNIADKELSTRIISLVEYLGEKGTCVGAKIDVGEKPGHNFLVCRHDMSCEVDDITNCFGIYISGAEVPAE